MAPNLPYRLCAAFLLTLTVLSVRAAPIIKTDIVFVQDVSASLIRGSVPNLTTALPDLAARFDALGVDARYALITFQASRYIPYINTNLTDVTGLQAAYSDPALASFSINEAFTPTINFKIPGELRFRSALGGENPFDALAVALNSLHDFRREAIMEFEFVPGGLGQIRIIRSETVSAGPQPEFIDYRPDAIKNIILLTDEPPQDTHGILPNGEFTFGPQTIADFAATTGALVNIVTNRLTTSFPGFPSQADIFYRPLTEATGGNLFDLDILASADPDRVAQFVEDFANTKFQELVDVCTRSPDSPGCENFSATPPGPAPIALTEATTLALLMTGLFGLWLSPSTNASPSRIRARA